MLIPVLLYKGVLSQARDEHVNRCLLPFNVLQTIERQQRTTQKISEFVKAICFIRVIIYFKEIVSHERFLIELILCYQDYHRIKEVKEPRSACIHVSL